MPDAINLISTRQETEELAHTAAALAVGTPFISDVVKVVGYDHVTLLGIADTAFTVQIEEACLIDGPFVVTHSLNSSLVGTGQVLCDQVEPCGNFMRISVWANLLPMTTLSFCAAGVPQP